jgi:hypothetical protein
MRIKKAILLSVTLFLFVSNIYSVNQRSNKETQNLRSVKSASRTAIFNENMVAEAKHLCNSGVYRSFSEDGQELIEFWFKAKELNLGEEQAYTCMRLFYNNIKSCEIIDDTVTKQFAKAAPELFDKYFEVKITPTEPIDLIRANVESLLLNQFINRVETFKNAPDVFVSKLSAEPKPEVFISKLSSDITNIVKSRLAIIHQDKDDSEFREKLRNMIIRFIDSMVGKTFWYVDSYRGIWSSFLEIADSLFKIGRRRIINDQDNLDELWHSLVTRFTWWLDLKGSELPVEFYKQIEDDLHNNVVFFLEAPEQDDGIIRKKELLAEAILKAKAKAIAYEHAGVITDQEIRKI